MRRYYSNRRIKMKEIIPFDIWKEFNEKLIEAENAKDWKRYSAIWKTFQAFCNDYAREKGLTKTHAKMIYERIKRLTTR